MNYWLLKSEEECYSIADLKRDKVTPWSGVRNYQARNFMMREMEVGDLALFYHSSSKQAGVYGIAKIVSEAHPDETQFDPNNEHYDPKASKEKPIWFCVDVAFVEIFNEPITLLEIKRDSALEGMLVRARGSRLSIQPVSKEHFEHIVSTAYSK